MTATYAWNYFNGTQHVWNGPNGYIPPVPLTLAYCSKCGPTHIPNFAATTEETRGREHWDTGFKCAPWRIGRPCDGCGKDI